MSPHLYRRLMRDKLAKLREHAGSPLSLALNPVSAKRLRYGR